MSITNTILFLALVGSVASYNEVVLQPWQTNLIINGTAVALGSLVKTYQIMAAAGNILYFWHRAHNQHYDSPPQ